MQFQITKRRIASIQIVELVALLKFCSHEQNVYISSYTDSNYSNVNCSNDGFSRDL